MKRLDRLLGDENKAHIASLLQAAIAGLLLVIALVPLAGSRATASTVAEEFTSVGAFESGSIVSLSQDNPEDIELGTLSNSEYLLGVVTDEGDNIVTYAKNNATVTVSVAGEVFVFVSNANGDVKTGDFIGASWLEGVGMKAAVSTNQKLLGVALEDFSIVDARDYGSIETNDGSKSVFVDVVKVRLFDKEGAETTVASSTGIESFLASIAGRNVSFVKVLAGSIIFVMSVLIAGFFVSSSIRGSFISIGRNPMASASIYRSLVHVTMASVVIILIGTAVTYVVLVI